MKVKALTYNQLQTLCWTEDNRLQAVKDNQMGAYYNYDASGERNLKLTGAVVQMSQNGVPYDYVMLESPTLYASGLITINERGYTKHYFEENKRVCSNIGGGFRDAGYDIMEPIELITPFEDQWTNAKEGIFNTFDECIKSKLDLEKSSEKIVQVMKDHEKDRNEAEYQFYYTNDHLGSSTYITDQDGKITQTLAYLPYGEDWIDLDNHPPYLTQYKFNGKEKDQETGYQYFGARYLNPKLSIWLSVDPMSDKYPHLTSYNYCANNPVMLVDPDGREIDNFYNMKSELILKTEEGNNNYLVITEGKEVANNPIIGVPSNETVDKIGEIYNSKINEQGIAVGTDGQSSQIITGSDNKISSEQWQPAIDEIQNNGTIDYLVHLHTSDFDKGDIGAPHPSGLDNQDKNFYKSNVGVVLGKEKNLLRSSNSMKFYSDPKDYDNTIGFYTKGSDKSFYTMKFKTFKEVINKINQKILKNK